VNYEAKFGIKYLAGIFVVGLITCASLQAQTYGRPNYLKGVGITQKMGAQLPLDVPFTDEQGRSVTLREYTGKPMVLALVYYSCPSLCDRVLEGAMQSLHALKFTAGNEFNFVAISFDPRETTTMARNKKMTMMRTYARPGTADGFHFLIGSEWASKAVADAVGFHYNYLADVNQYAHPAAIMIATPTGKVSRYFYGVYYPDRDVKLGLMDATGGKIGSPIDQLELYCCNYNPATGKYGVVIMNVLRLGGLITLAFLGGAIWLMFRKEHRLGRPVPEAVQGKLGAKITHG
jgi:protein SCO1/2